MDDNTSPLPAYSLSLVDNQQDVSSLMSSLSQSTIQQSAMTPNDEQAQTLHSRMISRDLVESKLNILQSSLSTMTSFLPSSFFPMDLDKKTSKDIKSPESTLTCIAEDPIQAKFREIEHKVAKVTFLLSRPCIIVSQPALDLELEKPPCDADSLTILRHRVEWVKNILFDLEKTVAFVHQKPAPPSNTSDDKVFLIWCESDGLWDYKRRIFGLLERLANEESMEEDKVLVYRTKMPDLAPRNNRIQAKIEKIKQSAASYYFENKRGKTRPRLPARSTLMTTEEFLVWCLRSSNFDMYRRLDGTVYHWPNNQSYEQELARVIQELKIALNKPCRACKF
ncbi:hypothetical protein BGZ49_008244 [Haplosporangium sp. Z 27]|nr:hypothetical protein BGZ49_008244 [Haplosporangium sp. Z 27]